MAARKVTDMPSRKPSEASRGGLLPGAGGQPDRVWFSCGLTINTGNYESVKVDAGMSTDVRDKETPAQAMQRCKDLVIDEANGQASEVREALNPEPSKKRPPTRKKRR